jgi:hypothetical protein
MTNDQKPKVKTEKKTEKVSINKDTKQDRFKRIASERQHKVIDRIAILGKIADNPQNYDFDEEDIFKLFDSLEAFTAEIKQRFLNCIGSKEIKNQYKIDL